MIDLEKVRKEYSSDGESSVVLESCTLKIPNGAFVAVLGPSGSGKTTLLNLIGGLDTATSGTVLIEGTDLGKLDRWGLTDLRRKTVGFIFQFYNLIPTLTARENVLCSLELLGVAAGEARRRADAMLAAVGLEGKGDLFPAQLSGGQQQRVAIARALVKKPPLVLADEPTGNLDRKLGAQVMDLLVALREETGTTLVVVTHDPTVAERADLVVHIDEGIIEPGPGTESFAGSPVS